MYAVNAMLPFRTQSSGFLSSYVPGVTAGVVAKFLTPFTRPVHFSPYPFRISWIKDSADAGDYIKIDRYNYSNGNYTLDASNVYTITDMDQGVYRYDSETGELNQANAESRLDVTIYNSSNVQLSETLTIDVKSDCSQYGITPLYMRWLNYLGGEDFWLFTAQKLYSVEVLESKTQDINIYNDWPNSWGEFSDSITRQTGRRSRNTVKVSSQYLTAAQRDAVAWIVSSPMVQILTSTPGSFITLWQTVIVEAATLKKYQENDNLYSISFNISYTDELPAQTS